MWGKKQNTSTYGALEQLKAVNHAQDNIILKMQTLKTYSIDVCKDIDFKKSLHIEYADNVFMKDLSTDEQSALGISMFHMKVNKTTHSPLHSHDKQSQLVYVRKGNIYDKVSKVRFGEGESLFLSRKNKHEIKYLKGSEVIIIYVPGLETL